MLEGRSKHRVLIVDQHTTYPLAICRSLARRSTQVDVFAELSAPALRSRYCHRRFVSPPWYAGDSFVDALQSVVTNERYDSIYVCSEEILRTMLPWIESSPAWERFPHPEPESFRTLLSKNTVLDRLRSAGIAVPRTLIPDDDNELERFGRTLGFPVVVKGERGGAAQNIRIVYDTQLLRAAYKEIAERERAYRGRPALQEFIRGATYFVGGVFDRGQALRICAARMVLMYPPNAGAAVLAVTERPPGLIEIVTCAFQALKYTGLGQADVIENERDGSFKILEINPRVWASIGLAEYAGVDLFSAYHDLARGMPVAVDLAYREGVRYHRLTSELRLILRRPQRILGFAKDCLDPAVHSDFDWRDLGPYLGRFGLSLR